MVARADLEVGLRVNDQLTPSLRNIESSIIRFVGAISAALAGLQVISFPIRAATEFDRALRDVQKTTGETDAQIAQLGDRLVSLSTDLGRGASDLASIAAAAGQLGIRGQEDILQFTESIARAAVTLDLVEESAARAIAKILNVFDIEASQTERITATINELTNSTAAQADELINVIQRVGSVAGLSFEQVAALGATAIESGLSPEVAGTSLVKFFSRLQEDADKFAEELGISIGEFTARGAFDQFQLFLDFAAQQNPQRQAELISTLAGGGRVFAVFNKFVQDAGNATNEFGDQIATLNDQAVAFEDRLGLLNAAIETFDPDVAGDVQLIDLEGERDRIESQLEQIRNTVEGFQDQIRLSNLTQNINTSTSAFQDGTSAIEEYERISRALERRVEILRTSFTALAISAGNQLLPRLVELADALSEFLQSDRAARLAESFGQQLLFIGESAADAARAVASLNIPLEQVLQVLRAFAALTVGRLFLSFGAAAARFALSLGGLTPLLSGLLGIVTRIIAPIGRFLGITNALSGAFATLRVVFLGNPIGLAITAIGAALVGVIGRFTDFNALLERFQELGLRALNIIGIQSAGQIAADEAQAEALAKLKDEAIDAGRAFREAVTQNRIADTAGLEDFEIKVGLDASSAVDQVNQLVQDFERLSAGAESVDTVIESLARRLESSQQAASEAADALSSLNAQLSVEQQQREELVGAITRARLAGEDTTDLSDQIAQLDEQIEKTRGLVADRERAVASQNKISEAVREETDRVNEQAGILRERLENLREGIVGSFSDEGIQLLDLESERLRIQSELEEIKKTIEEFNPQDFDTPELALFEEGQLQQKSTELKAQLDVIKKDIEEFRDGVNSGDQALIGKLIEERDANAVKDLTEDLVTARKEGEKFGNGLKNAFKGSAAEIFAQKFILEDLIKIAKQGLETLKDTAEVAKSVADNTLTELRALQSGFQEFATSIDALLQDRAINIKFDRRTARLDNQLENILSEQEAVEAQFAERINNARNESERSYFRNRQADALAALRAEEGILRNERASLEERALTERLNIAQQRAREFIRLAQQAAQQGNLDEALGLKDAGKRSLEEAQGLVTDLANLTTDVGGDIKAALNDSEVERLVNQLTDVQKGVAAAVPDINETLKDSTQKAFEEASKNVEALSKEFEEVNKQTQALTAGLKDAEGAVKRLREAFDQTAAGQRLGRAVQQAQGAQPGPEGSTAGRLTGDQITQLGQSIKSELENGRSTQAKQNEQFLRDNRDSGREVADRLEQGLERGSRDGLSNERFAPADPQGFDPDALNFQALARAIQEQNDAQAQVQASDRIAQRLDLLRQEQRALQQSNPQAEALREQLAELRALPPALQQLNQPTIDRLESLLQDQERPQAEGLQAAAQALTEAAAALEEARARESAAAISAVQAPAETPTIQVNAAFSAEQFREALQASLTNEQTDVNVDVTARVGLNVEQFEEQLRQAGESVEPVTVPLIGDAGGLIDGVQETISAGRGISVAVNVPEDSGAGIVNRVNAQIESGAGAVELDIRFAEPVVQEEAAQVQATIAQTLSQQPFPVSLTADVQPLIDALNEALNNEGNPVVSVQLKPGNTTLGERIQIELDGEPPKSVQLRPADGTFADIRIPDQEVPVTPVTPASLDQIFQGAPPVETEVQPEQGTLQQMLQSIQQFFADNPVKIKTEADVTSGGTEQTAANFVRGATGGLLRGPGSGTSDSIPAMLSNGEFVIDNFTRQFFGADFFSMLQKLAKGGKRLKLPEFRTGGIVGKIPSDFSPVISASGAGGSPVHIHLPGGDTVKLREGDTDVNTVTKMFRREAAKRGRKV